MVVSKVEVLVKKTSENGETFLHKETRWRRVKINDCQSEINEAIKNVVQVPQDHNIDRKTSFVDSVNKNGNSLSAIGEQGFL
jgi:hypothetical protein